MKKILPLVFLIIAGELIFALPFHVIRFFRPSLLEDYYYTNMQLGIAFSIYGITAFLSYLPGGYIADKVTPKYLLFFSLFMTSLGGIFYMINPNIYGLYFLFGYWGITTILFFWAALIKVTRSIAGNNQGASFGALEAGRGLVASLSASIAVLLYTSNTLLDFLKNNISISLSPLAVVIFFYSFVTFLSSIIILFFFKEEKTYTKNKKIKYNINEIYKNRKPILCISIIVFSAYACYKAIDYYSLYFYEIVEFSKEKSAYVMTLFSYIRPVAALLAGFIADKITPRVCTKYLFVFMVASYAFLSIFNLDKEIISIVYLNLIISMVGVFALRGIFYSLLEDSYIPSSITGAAVGIVSFIGYLPDVFIGPLFGFLFDLQDIKRSFQIFFIFLLLISTLGLVTSIYLKKN